MLRYLRERFPTAPIETLQELPANKQHCEWLELIFPVQKARITVDLPVFELALESETEDDLPELEIFAIIID